MSRNERITTQIPAPKAQKSQHYGVKYTKYFSYRQKVEKKMCEKFGGVKNQFYICGER
jgi:hypothetical protein